MSTGPIEFENSMVDTMGPTEYGGEPGLVAGQPNGDRSVRSIDHLAHLRTSERLGLIRRSKSTVSESVTVDEDGATTIVQTLDAEGIDPVTGLGQDAADSEEVTTDTVSPAFGV